MWAKSPDLTGDGVINVADKLSYDDALAQAGGFTLAGYDDWRLPTIKEMYSLMDCRGWRRLSLPGFSRSRPSLPRT